MQAVDGQVVHGEELGNGAHRGIVTQHRTLGVEPDDVVEVVLETCYKIDRK